MTAILVSKIGSELCRTLGIDPDKTLSIEFLWMPGDIATIVVKMLADDGIIPVLRKYELREKTEEAKT